VNDSFRIQYRAAPAAPYTLDAVIDCTNAPENYGACGIGWRQASDGKLVLYYVVYENQPMRLSYRTYTNATTYSGSYFNLSSVNGLPIRLRLQDNNTNRIVSLCNTNWDCVQMHSISRTDFITADQLLFMANAINANYATISTLISWKVY